MTAQVAEPRQNIDSRVLDEVVAAYGIILSLEEPGPTTDFFAEGGDSLGAVWLINMLKEKLSVRLRLGLLLKNPRAEDLALEISRRRRRRGLMRHLRGG